MITLMLAEIFLKAAVLCILLILFARHEADYSFQKVAVVTAAITLGSILLEAFGKATLGWLILIPLVAFILFMLTTFCWVRWWKALIITVLFLAFNIVLAYGVSLVMKRANRAVANALTKAMPGREDIMEIKEFMRSQSGSPVAMPGSEPVEPIPGTITSAPPTGLAAWLAGTTTNVTTAVVTGAVNWAAAETRLKVGGMMVGSKGQKIVTVNNRLLEAGEKIQVEYAGRLYLWQLKRLDAAGVAWERLAVREINPSQGK